SSKVTNHLQAKGSRFIQKGIQQDSLGKFDGKADEGFLVGYSINSKAFRVFNTRTRKVEENLHINLLENKPNVAGSGPKWLFDIDSLTKSMNYEQVTARNQTNGDAVIETNVNAGQAGQEKASDHEYILLPLMLFNSPLSSTEFDNLLVQQKEGYANNTNRASTVNPSVSTAGQGFDNVDDQERIDRITQDVNIVGPTTGIFDDAYDDREEVGAEADLNNLVTTMNELLQFKLQKVWTLVDLPKGKRAIGTKWVYRNKKDERGIVVRNKAKLVAQGYTQEEGIDYDDVFSLVARIEAMRLILANASFMRFIVYQMDVKSAFLYGTIKEEVYVCQPLGFEDPQFPDKVYVDDIIFGSIKKSLCVEFEQMMHKRFQMSSMRELTFFLGLQVMQKDDGIFISQDKYMVDILKKFDFVTIKEASTPIDTNKALNKDEEFEDVDRIFRYLKGQPKLGLWYPMDSPFDLEAFSDSDYAGASLDRKSTTGGCQFLGKRLISWQCKKQTIVANSTTEAEYVAAANCYGQVLWIQNQMLDYGFNFMNTKIHIDNESTICIVKNPVFHSKTNHIKIRHHFIRDSYEKKLIQVIKIHTDHNVADLLTKAFDVSRSGKTEWKRATTTASSLEAEQDSGSGPRIGVDTAMHKLNTASIKLVLPGIS
ncbi:putative ribonuclease H-like domain-containing protein, partial [Tanacetum coccineum]